MLHVTQIEVVVRQLLLGNCSYYIKLCLLWLHGTLITLLRVMS